MEQYKKYYLENGMTLEDLEKDAKLVSGYDPTASISNTYRKSILALGDVARTTNYSDISYNFNKIGTQCATAISSGVYDGCKAAIANIGQVCSDTVKNNAASLAESGAAIASGLIDGLKDKSEAATTAAVDLAQNVMNALEYVINSEGPIQPVIKPILDLSNIHDYVPAINPSLSIQLASGINFFQSREAQNGENNSNNGNTYQFTQNNYSPKALSRIEIYRQTKNQFTAMKGALV